ncbi:hypothetical protein, partial [Bradyrhizobium sp. 33ap4]|uniref:hypothetical protein n=1 Tax=Bradyrhizobium sp. 33ap4 TaxID=3061630 RepID=UPI00292CBDA9
MSEKYDFYVYLLSNASMNVHPGNTLSNFTVALDRPLRLGEDYEVGLQEMSLPNLFYNVTDSIEDNTITATRTSLQDLVKTFQAHTNLESSLQSILANSNVLMKYDRDHYSFVLPENIPGVKIADKEVHEWIGASVITHSTLHGSVVPRKNESIELTEVGGQAVLGRQSLVSTPWLT